jgi:hypothetical protein
MTSPESSHMKNVTTELRFSLVTHTIWSLRQFEALLQFWTRDGQIEMQVFGHVFRPHDG